MQNKSIDFFIMAAMADELAALKTNKLVGIIQTGKGRWQIRRLSNGKQVATAVCGIRAPKAEVLIKAAKAEGMCELLFVGCCGGLDREMCFEKIVVAKEIISTQIEQNIYHTSKNLTEKIVKVLPEANVGKMVCAPHVLETITQKQECYNKTKALAVEMEGTIVAAAADKYDVKLAMVKWVLDGEQENISNSIQNKIFQNSLGFTALHSRMRKISLNIASFVENLSEMM